MKELLIRSLSGLVLGGVVLACILISPLTFASLALLICAIGTYEMARLQGVTNLFHLFIGEVIVVTAYIVAALVGLELASTKWLLVELLFPLLTFLMALFSKRYDFKSLSSYVFGSLLFLALPMSQMVYFYRQDLFGNLAGSRIIILIFCLLWTNDIFAYLTGRLFGRHKLFERISPGKTIEGSFGGLLFTSIGIAVFCHYASWLPVSTGISLGFIAVIFGTLGDLCESMLKRQAGVKDSGKLIPGHGGILDRFDSVLFTVPFVFVFLQFL